MKRCGCFRPCLCRKSFVTQCDHRIDPGGATRGQKTLFLPFFRSRFGSRQALGLFAACGAFLYVVSAFAISHKTLTLTVSRPVPSDFAGLREKSLLTNSKPRPLMFALLCPNLRADPHEMKTGAFLTSPSVSQRCRRYDLRGGR